LMTGGGTVHTACVVFSCGSRVIGVVSTVTGVIVVILGEKGVGVAVAWTAGEITTTAAPCVESPLLWCTLTVTRYVPGFA